MSEYEKIKSFAEKYAVKVGATLSDKAETIYEGLVRNKQMHGVQLCPCKFYAHIGLELESRKNVCPCKEFRETKFCHCGLFKFE